MSFAPLLAMSLDKGADSFGQSGNHPRNDLFDQYLTFDTISVDGSIYLTAPESTLPVSKVKGSNSAGTSIKVSKDEAGQTVAPRSRGEPLQLDSAASPHDKFGGNVFQLEDSGRAVGPDFALLSLEKISLQSPRLKTPPSSPELLINKKTRARHQILKGFHKPFQNERDNKTIRKSTSPIKKAICPAKMRRSQYGDENTQNWGQQLASDASKFDFDFQNTPLSPPPSGQVSESSENNSYMMAPTQQQNSSYAWDPPISEQYAYRTTEDIESPLTTPPADMSTFNQSNMQHISANNMIYTTSHRDQSSTPWIQTPMNSDYTFEASTSYAEESDSPIWWGNAATTPLVEPAPSAYRRQNEQNMQSLAMQLQAELAYNANELALSPSNMPSGLMIQLPDTPTGQSFVVRPSPINAEAGYFAGAAASPAVQPHSIHLYPPAQPHNYAPLPTRTEKPHSHSHSHSHSQSQSRTQSFSTSPSPQPRPSSMHVAKKTHSSSSSRKRAGDSHNSSTKNSSSSSHTGHGHSYGHSHSHSHSHGQKQPKGNSSSGNSNNSKSSSNSSNSAGATAAAAAAADFVNFTPKDSNKILTGVAPSGSSKTKARREREAAEKSRRLSQAAVRAVQAAGGSIDTLVEEGLFEEEELGEMA